jgi:pimeloyl-ACP methyl ester carboxylesterase
MANLIGNLGNFWFFRYLNAVSTHPDPPEPLPGIHGAEVLASSVGPSERECMTSPNGGSEITYSDSVLQRARSGNGGWSEKIRVYRDDLIFGPWEKSLETLWDLNQIEQSSGRRNFSNPDLFDVGPSGTCKAPTTVIWGKGDVAIENSIAVDGIGDYFGSRSSQMISLTRVGHWAPMEKQGIPVFEEVISWAIEGEKGSLKDRLGDDFPVAKIVIER